MYASKQSYTTWEAYKDFISPNYSTDNGGICVRVSILKLVDPVFSMALGWLLPSGELKLHLQQNADINPDDVAKLLSEAKTLIDTQVAEVNRLRTQREADEKKRREEESQKKLLKKQRYNNNKKIRAEENRQRASGSGGKRGK